MIYFGSGCSSSGSASASALAAARQARDRYAAREDPKLAVVFVATGGRDGREADEVFDALRAELPGASIVGGTASGAVIGPDGFAREGVSVVLLGGDLEVATRSVRVESETQLEVVPVARELLAEADEAARQGMRQLTCLLFAPGSRDGDSLVAAVRKGVGQRARLAGAMTGAQVTPTSPQVRVFAGDRVATDLAVLVGLFTAAPFGVAARHGWRKAGRARHVTRSDGPWLVSLDGKPALDAWAADARAAGGDVPPGRTQQAVDYLRDHFALDVRAGDADEPVVRVPLDVREDGAVRLTAGVGEGAQTRILTASRTALLDAATAAARAAVATLDTEVVGAIVLSCGSRLVNLGAEFAREAEAVSRALDVQVGGACVRGEIARGHGDVEAFHNGTVVVLAIPASSRASVPMLRAAAPRLRGAALG